MDGRRRTTRIRIGAALAAAASLLVAGALGGDAAAQEWTARDCKQVPIRELEAPDAFNKRLMTELTVRAISGLQLVAAETELRFQLAPDIRDVADAIHEGDTVRVFGFVTPDRGTGGRFFYVKRLESATATKEDLGQELARLRAAENAAELVKLGDRVTTLGGSEVASLAREAYAAAAEIERQRLDPKDAKAVVGLAHLYASRLDDRQKALDLLTGILDDRAPIPFEVDQQLKEIRAVRYGPDRRWMLVEDMKRAEGFIQHRGQWVKPERAQFLDVVQERQQASTATLRDPALETIFGDAARTRQVLVGMLKREVHVARGYPAAIDRVRAGTKTYDVWRYADGAALYFEDDLLFRKP